MQDFSQAIWYLSPTLEIIDSRVLRMSHLLFYIFFPLPLILQVLIILQQLVTTKTSLTKMQRAHKHGSTYKNGNANCAAG